MLIRMLKQNFSYLEIKKKEKKKNKTNHSFKLSGPRRRKSKNKILEVIKGKMRAYWGE